MNACKNCVFWREDYPEFCDDADEDRIGSCTWRGPMPWSLRYGLRERTACYANDGIECATFEGISV